MEMKYAGVPANVEEAFLVAQEYVKQYFSAALFEPEQGTITVKGERYILVRAASMSVYFLEFIRAMYPHLDDPESVDVASRVLYDLASFIGRADAKQFHKATGVSDSVAKLSTGPIHFAFSGWAFVDIHPESRPVAGPGYILVYDHINSFEADSWIKIRGRTGFCTCFMNAGYSSGWCTESFGLELKAREITCRARGDGQCRFVMAPPDLLPNAIRSYLELHHELSSADRGGP